VKFKKGERLDKIFDSDAPRAGKGWYFLFEVAGTICTAQI